LLCKGGENPIKLWEPINQSWVKGCNREGRPSLDFKTILRRAGRGLYFDLFSQPMTPGENENSQGRDIIGEEKEGSSASNEEADKKSAEASSE